MELKNHFINDILKNRTTKNEIFFIIPHPDDEAIGCAILIKRLRDINIHPTVILLTSGGAIPEIMSEITPEALRKHELQRKLRISEFKKSMSLLKIKKVAFLNYPTKTLIYNMSALLEKIKLITKASKHPFFFVPAYEGAHPDHDTANFIISRIDKGSCFEYLGYNMAKGYPCYQEFIDHPESQVIDIDLTASEKIFKERILDIYRSQRKIMLKNFSAGKELFRIKPDYDYSKPPHKSPLYYENIGISMKSEKACEFFNNFSREA